MFLRYLRPEKRQKSYPERHEFRKCHVSLLPEAREMPKKPTQKDTTFGNAKILHYLEPGNCQNQPQKTRISHQTALIDPSKNAKESIQFSRILHITLNALINPNHTNQTTTWEHLVACCLNCRPIVTHSDSSTLAQDAILNCYKKPAHYHYHFPDFQKTSFILCSILAQIRSGC